MIICFQYEKLGFDRFDPVYASFASRLASINDTNPFNTCRSGQTSCNSFDQCIDDEKWCDNVVDCVDSSDETFCSCSSRLNDNKICDGFLDCPLGSDEIGCFGCNKRSYSCFNNIEEFQSQSKFSSGPMCYTLVQKCDGFTDCHVSGESTNICFTRMHMY